MAKPRPPRFLKLKILAGLVFASVGVYCIATYLQFETVAVHAEGKVIDIRSETRRTGRRNGAVTISRPVVEFALPNSTEKVTALAQVASRTEFNRGDNVAIEFDPHAPSSSVRLEAGPALIDLGVGGLGLVLLAIATYEQLSWTRARKMLTATS